MNSFFKKTPRIYLKVLRTSSGPVANYAQVKEGQGAQAKEKLVEESLTLAFRGSDRSSAFDACEKNLELALSKEEWKVRKSASHRSNKHFICSCQLTTTNTVYWAWSGLSRKRRERI